MKRLVMLSVWLLALVWAANASDIYNNLGSSTSGSDAVSTLGPLADSFSTGPGNFQLNMVGVLLNGDPTIRGTVSIDLLSNRRTPLSPNAPGSFLLQLGTVSDASLSSSSADFFFSAAYPLAPNTRYWIQVSGTTAYPLTNSANWAWSLDQTALGVAGEFWANRNGVASNVLGPYQMEVNVVSAGGRQLVVSQSAAVVQAPVPEPSALLLLGSGLIGAIGAVRRKLT